MTPVGNYATRIAFDDGHNTGLYTWGYLHSSAAKKIAAGANTSKSSPPKA